MLTHQYLLECLRYNPEYGFLIWNERPRYHFKSNREQTRFNNRYSNKVSGWITFNGYVMTSIGFKGNQKNYFSHRLVWFIVNKRMPLEFIDHINGNKADNRIINLREADSSINAKNRCENKNNTSGYNGVSWHKKRKKYQSLICIDKKRIHLGYFENINDAIKARLIAENNFGFHFNHGRKSNL